MPTCAARWRTEWFIPLRSTCIAKITLETGKVAKQANGAVVVRSGDNVVLVTAVLAEKPKPVRAFSR